MSMTIMNVAGITGFTSLIGRFVDPDAGPDQMRSNPRPRSVSIPITPPVNLAWTKLTAQLADSA
jgi:hypothetical protein